MTLEWFGDRVYAHAVEAASGGAIETVDGAVAQAARDTPVLTGAARDSLHREGEGLDLRWGYGVAYGIWIEIGARGRAGVHALRRAADSWYPGLVGRIRRRFAL